MINHIWRERLTLRDRLIALKPSAVPFGVACGLESLRRYGIARSACPTASVAVESTPRSGHIGPV